MGGRDRIAVAARFVNGDRQAPMILPGDLRERGPADHSVHVNLDAVGPIPPARFQVKDRGAGSGRYPPPMMMLALPICCYAPRPVWLPEDRSGEPRRRGGALSVRQSASGPFFQRRGSGVRPGSSGLEWVPGSVLLF